MVRPAGFFFLNNAGTLGVGTSRISLLTNPHLSLFPFSFPFTISEAMNRVDINSD